MEENPRRPDRLVLLTDDALLDFANADNSTEAMWGKAQAERYTAFLNDTMRALAEAPQIGKRVAQRLEYRVYLAKFKRSRWTHGHRILYRETDGGIEVIRILHSRMELRRHLPKAKA